jgi:C4-dicarboxylate transporter DctQ subunit
MGWAQELCIIMFVWMAKFGAAYGVRTGIHVGVDVLINRMSDSRRAKFVIFGLAGGRIVHRHCRHAGGAFCVGKRHALLCGILPLGAVPGDLPEGPTTPDLEWPTWMVYAVIPLGVPDVFSLFAGHGQLCAHRRTAPP